ncbi:unnamed protein product [Brachionus calyciflorus]|uniref:Uncharacterized protein n=1 Tax=Brachionus calyciflorus TaxID=104777 RepID=A0A813ZLK4_9BILA|nr:unnamed protein product [Brachionus calyciflorus]
MFPRDFQNEDFDKEKLRILQNINNQIQSMALRLDLIVGHVEENIFKIKSSNSNNFRNSLLEINNSLEIKPILYFENRHCVSQIENNRKFNSEEDVAIDNRHVVKIIDNFPKVVKKSKKKISKKKTVNINEFNDSKQSILNLPTQQKQECLKINKRSKQQRIFNTFVRESINQLLGSDFMRTHDVQDIDPQVMEMIRKEAVEHYLPENIRPRRAWHLAKASLRTLKRTLNNRKQKE